MIKLLVPAMIGGRLLPTGTLTVASAELEEKLIAAGNARQEPAVPAAGWKDPDEDTADPAEPDAPAEKERADTDLKLGRGGVQSK